MAKAKAKVWRFGSKIKLNVYEGDRPVCQCHSEDDARRIVAAMNREGMLKAIFTGPRGEFNDPGI